MTKEYLLHLFEYDRENGLLIWKNHWNKNTLSKIKGKIAGNLHYDVCGLIYRTVMINEKQYCVHRLIWFIETEKIPNQIDHIDGNGLNNRISNLRNVTNSQNQRNRITHRNGRLANTHFCKTTNRWRAQICVKGKKIHLGRFDTEREAHLASTIELFALGEL